MRPSATSADRALVPAIRNAVFSSAPALLALLALLARPAVATAATPIYLPILLAADPIAPTPLPTPTSTPEPSSPLAVASSTARSRTSFGLTSTTASTMRRATSGPRRTAASCAGRPAA